VPDTQQLDRYLSVQEICAALQLSRKVVVGLFENEPDVVVLGTALTTKGKQRYRTLRIPLSVYNRKVRQLSNRKGAQ
jgi:uracil-DNA glycosylase